MASDGAALRVRGLIAVLALAALAAWPSDARAEDAKTKTPPFAPSRAVAAVVWTGMQLVPSPMAVAGSGPASFGVRWQVTPLLFSFGVTEKPFRAFVVEPVARHAGAIEIYASPEWTTYTPNGSTGWIARGGGRLYLPIVGRGEILSASLGGSYYRAAGGDGASVDAGIYTLFNTFGLTVTVNPTMDRREVMTALSIRYF